MTALVSRSTGAGASLAIAALAAAAARARLRGHAARRGSDAAEPPRASGAEAETAQATPTPTPPPELPRGGRKLFPEYRVVGFFGAPQDDALGALGIGTPAQMARRLRKASRPYRRGGAPRSCRRSS